ncbi:MAG TPA: sulfotransferase [Planctomycetaceae bacterium]|jgi:hypothetical protein|nr:sulfotransferase [Planctomycetaceae bacterium]
MNLPTFLIGGAPRAGTTFLYEVLAEHPDVFLAKPRNPEPKFFLVDDEYQKGLAYYSHKYFSGADREKPGEADAGGRPIVPIALGEKSTNYLENPRVADRIRGSLPDVKLLFVLRNPIERAFSNYLWSKKNLLETLPFDEAIATEATREARYSAEHRYSRPFSYVSRGIYACHLRPYYAAFPREQILVVLLEDLEHHPEARIDAICRFLGVRPLQFTGERHRRVNTARQGNEQLDPRTRDKLKEIYREPNRELAELLQRDLSHWS